MPHGVPEPPRAVPMGCTWPRVPHPGEMLGFHLLGKKLSSADITSRSLWKNVLLNTAFPDSVLSKSQLRLFLFCVKIKRVCIHSGDPWAGGAAEAAVRSGARPRQVAPCCSPGSPQRGAVPSPEWVLFAPSISQVAALPRDSCARFLPKLPSGSCRAQGASCSHTTALRTQRPTNHPLRVTPPGTLLRWVLRAEVMFPQGFI